MPRDDALRYFVPGAFGTHTISHMSCMSHTRAANSSCMYPHPYPSALSLIKRIDQAGDRLGDLETGCCRCRDVVMDSPPVSSESP